VPALRSQKSRTIQWRQSGEERTATLPLLACAYSTSETIRSIGILLHGYGDESENFLECAREFGTPGVLWVSLDAPHDFGPQVPVASGKMWFDLFHDPAAAIARSTEAIMGSIRILADSCGLPVSRLFLLGFSQGGFMALHCGLSSALGAAPAAIVSLSGFLMGGHRLEKPSPSAARTPIFLGHGTHDQVVLPLWHFETIDILNQLGYSNVHSHCYAVAHSLHPEEIKDIRALLKDVI
jgi:phospholipase/carboxylesterase